MTTELLQTAPIAAELLGALRAQVAGGVLLPGDAAYDTARLDFNLSVRQFPAVIVVAENAADVMAAVRFARAAGLPVSVQSTGHGTVRAADDTVLIVTSRMNDVQVDAAAQTASVSAGAVRAQVLGKAQAAGGRVVAPSLARRSRVFDPEGASGANQAGSKTPTERAGRAKGRQRPRPPAGRRASPSQKAAIERGTKQSQQPNVAPGSPSLKPVFGFREGVGG